MRFEAEAGVLFVDSSSFACQGTVEEIAGVELESRLSGVDFEDASAAGFENACGQFRAFSGSFIEDEVEVVADRLSTRAGQILADRLGLGEIEGGIANG